MRVFIVHAHHEPKSFNAALTTAATEALQGANHQVRVSDLYAMRFDPVSDRRNFLTVRNTVYLRQQDEERYAAERDGFAPDIEGEMNKLFWCEALILQFPLWWFGLPAILKGWVDRVFALGRVYGGGRFYRTGVFAGKRALCSITIGGPPSMYGVDGVNGPLSTILYPIQHGILSFTGFTVWEPFLVHAPRQLGHEERRAHVQRYRNYVLQFSSSANRDFEIGPSPNHEPKPRASLLTPPGDDRGICGGENG